MQKLGSTSGEPEFVAQNFFKIPASAGFVDKNRNSSVTE
jgi:hypothetical protein